MSTIQWQMDSKIGPLYLVASAQGLRGVFWKKRPEIMVNSLEGRSPQFKILIQTIKQLEEYLEGQRQSFDLPLDVEGTEFQKRVWEQLSLIPYGKTCSYIDIARKLKKNGASRAVGTANGKNPLSIIVPCHRVIASDGTLGGYAGGLEIKSRLLDLEKKITLAG